MKKRIILLFVLTLLSACENEKERVQANDKDFRIICIDGLSYLTYQGTVIKNFLQIYVPAEDPANPPQPKTCTSPMKTTQSI